MPPTDGSSLGRCTTPPPGVDPGGRNAGALEPLLAHTPSHLVGDVPLGQVWADADDAKTTGADTSASALPRARIPCFMAVVTRHTLPSRTR
jgi:hypothetical protein